LAKNLQKDHNECNEHNVDEIKLAILKGNNDFPTWCPISFLKKGELKILLTV